MKIYEKILREDIDMDKKVIKTDKAPMPVANYSQGVKVGETLYIQGVIALVPETNEMLQGDIKAQAERVFDSIEAILDEAGLSIDDAVKVTAFLKDLADYSGFNEVYNSRFRSEYPPVRTTVQAAMPLGALVEVEVIACES